MFTKSDTIHRATPDRRPAPLSPQQHKTSVCFWYREINWGTWTRVHHKNKTDGFESADVPQVWGNAPTCLRRHHFGTRQSPLRGPDGPWGPAQRSQTTNATAEKPSPHYLNEGTAPPCGGSTATRCSAQLNSCRHFSPDGEAAATRYQLGNKALLQKLCFVLGSVFQAKCCRTVKTKIRLLHACADGWPPLSRERFWPPKPYREGSMTGEELFMLGWSPILAAIWKDNKDHTDLLHLLWPNTEKQEPDEADDHKYLAPNLEWQLRGVEAHVVQ